MSIRRIVGGRSLSALAERVRRKSARGRLEVARIEREGARLRLEREQAAGELGVSLQDLERTTARQDLAEFDAVAAIRRAEESAAIAMKLLDDTEALQAELDDDLTGIERDIAEARQQKGGH